MLFRPNKYILLAVCVTLFASSCVEDDFIIGNGVISGEPFSTSKQEFPVTVKHIDVSSVQTNKLPLYQLGNYNDPVYGKTSARIISQFRLPSNNPTFGLLRQELEDLEDQGGVQDTLNEQERVNAAYLYIPYQQVPATNRDSDSDGVPDIYDEDPNSNQSDSDGDGLTDNEERLLGTNPLDPDTDGDGIADGQDACPKVAGPRGNRGCPWPDTDGDSVPDKDDKCPEVPGTVANDGCPEGPTAEDMAKITELSRGIQFAFGATTFTEGTPPVLDAIVSIILKYPTASFSVEGHTDSIGTKGFNQSLSERRAAAVVNYLSGRNVSADRLSAAGFGENNPIDTNVNSAGRANNRRVEILFVK